MPKWNPWSGADVSEEYNEAKAVVLEVMNSTSVAKLEQFAIRCKGHALKQQKKDIAGLLMALCQEPGLLAALDEPGRYPAWRPPLEEFLRTSRDLPVNDEERMLLRIFAGDDACVKSLSPTAEKAMEPFSVKNGRRMDDLLRWRMLGHLAGALVAAPANSLLSSLNRLMLKPQEFASGEPVFMPGMDEDIRNRVMKALMERGENIWKFKSHWYKCTVCGYNFFIGECGRPMEVSKCPECQNNIGGRDHQKTAQTTEDDESDRSPAGYCLPPAEKDEKHVTFREIPTSSARLIRLLLHGALFCGHAAHLPSNGATEVPRIYNHLINPDSQCTMLQTNEAGYIGAHFLNVFADG